MYEKCTRKDEPKINFGFLNKGSKRKVEQNTTLYRPSISIGFFSFIYFENVV